MKMYIGGEWVDRDSKIDVINPYNGSVIDTVPSGSFDDLETAMASAVRGAEVMRNMPGYRRFEILRRAADIMTERQDELGRTISMEEGKIIGEGSPKRSGRSRRSSFRARRPSVCTERQSHWTGRRTGRASTDSR